MIVEKLRNIFFYSNLFLFIITIFNILYIKAVVRSSDIDDKDKSNINIILFFFFLIGASSQDIPIHIINFFRS